jgi:hypothetical protein
MNYISGFGALTIMKDDIGEPTYSVNIGQRNEYFLVIVRNIFVINPIFWEWILKSLSIGELILRNWFKNLTKLVHHLHESLKIR